MRACRVRLFALALAAALAAPAALADQPIRGDHHGRSGVIIYFGEGGGHAGTDQHWPGGHHDNRHDYRQGYRDGFRDGRRTSRHHHRHERRQTHTFVVPPGLQTPATNESPQPQQVNPGGRHVMPSATR